MVDNGSSRSFAKSSLLNKLGLPALQKREPIDLMVFGSTRKEPGNYAKFKITIKGHFDGAEEREFFLLKTDVLARVPGFKTPDIVKKLRRQELPIADERMLKTYVNEADVTFSLAATSIGML